MSLLVFPMQDLLGARYWAVAGEPWTPRQCDSETQMLRRGLSTFLKFVLNSEEIPAGIEYSTACRGGEMSFHVVADCLKLERGYLSCSYFSWKFSRFVWQWINNTLPFLFPLRDSDAASSELFDVMLQCCTNRQMAKWSDTACTTPCLNCHLQITATIVAITEDEWVLLVKTFNIWISYACPVLTTFVLLRQSRTL
jgi:hypothetical protein